MSVNMQQVLGKYEILEEIGRGASAVVYKARDTALDRIVALKVMHPGLLWNPEAVERFLREARAAAQLEHPNIVTIYEVGEDQGSYYIAMGYLPGPSAADLIAQGPMPIEQAVDIAVQVADALGYAHQRGFIHRDVKPSNIILNARGQPILTDFGLVKALEWASLSGSGGVVGTPGYIAPEIWDGEQATAATDVYGLGVVLWEMLAGRRLFEGDTPAAVMKKHLVEPPPPLDEVRSDVPEALARVVDQALAKDPSHRHRGITVLIRALQRAMVEEKHEAPPDETTAALKGRRLSLGNLVADFTRLIELDSDRSEYYQWRGMSYHDKGDYDQAIADYTRAIELDPNKAIYYFTRGRSYMQKDEYNQAITDYSRAIELDPTDARYYCARGLTYRKKGDHDQAIADFGKLIKLDPTDSLYYGLLGVSYCEKGDYDRAIANFNHALELDPNEANYYYWRGLSYKRKEDKVKARADFEKAVTLGRADAGKELEKLR